MQSTDETQLSPVAAWELSQLPAIGALMLRLDFLSNAMQRPEDAHRGRNYAFQVPQARELAQKILAACDLLESGPPPGGTGPTH